MQRVVIVVIALVQLSSSYRPATILSRPSRFSSLLRITPQDEAFEKKRREIEIRRKIEQLRGQGRLNGPSQGSENMKEASAFFKKESPLNKFADKLATIAASKASTAATSSGIGGSWTAPTTTNATTYEPSTGSWGVFERPKDISKAYGGGKRVGVGTTLSESEILLQELKDQQTRDKLKQVN